jgi:hypothetical protein
MGKLDDYDSEDAATGERNYRSSMRSSSQKTSILKNSSIKKVNWLKLKTFLFKFEFLIFKN